MKPTTSKTVLGGVSMAIAMALLLGALALTQRPALAANIPISAVNFSFSPNDTTALMGDQAIFTNNGSETHGATAVDVTGTYPVLTMAPDESGAWQLTTAETIWYYCQFHATANLANEAGLAAGAMVGRIVVSQQTTATATTTTATATTSTATATATTPATSTPTSTATPTATATTPPPTSTATTPAETATVAPGPPATGTGSVQGTNNALLLIAAGFAAVGLAGGTLVAVRRRM